MTAKPFARKLRVFAFDPSLSVTLGTADVNEVTIPVRWEELEPGPVGEYLEVIDHDPGSGAFYEPVDLNHPYILSEHGLAPSESNPQFHQQMVYAVAMTTIHRFEDALGRRMFWADHRPNPGQHDYAFVRRLRIFPHGLRAKNAYYSPEKKSVLFGYFEDDGRGGGTPGTIVFSALSHDIVAHEVTHALLDGLHPRFAEPTNPDVLAFHEAFADIVALFQHFAYPGVLESQIRQTRGTLDSENLLAQLAQQFGQALGRGASLRDALGETNKTTGRWEPTPPNPRRLQEVSGAHARGSILVAAVFRAFLLLYRRRTADLFRIASGGTGQLPDGELHPDLTRRLATEAAECADRVLQMCIRATDYCPPVDITFGDFLRAVVTADLDYAGDIGVDYRLAFIQSFREWGIYPRGVRSLGLDALLWPSGETALRRVRAEWSLREGRSAPLQTQAAVDSRKANFRRGFFDRLDAQASDTGAVMFSKAVTLPDSDRLAQWRKTRRLSMTLHEWLSSGDQHESEFREMFGLELYGTPPSVTQSNGVAHFEIHAVRPAYRPTLYGGTQTDLVVEITQRRRGYFNRDVQRRVDAGEFETLPEPDFEYRAGCTLLLDPQTQEARRVIRTVGTITDDAAMDVVRRYLAGGDGELHSAFEAVSDGPEPFELLHRGH